MGLAGVSLPHWFLPAAAPGTSVLPSACQREELGADSRKS